MEFWVLRMAVDGGMLSRLPGPLLLLTGILMLPAVLSLSSYAGRFGVFAGFATAYGLLSVALGAAAIQRAQNATKRRGW